MIYIMVLPLQVCPRCILRLFGVKDNVFSISHFSKSFLCSVLERTTSIVTMGKDNDIEDEYNKVIAPPKSEATNELCIICFGILQFVYVYNKEQNLISEESGKDDLAVLVADLVKNAGYESDGFLLEVYVPSAIMINEQNIWSYMKNRYGSEDWYNKIIAANRLSVKDTLKLSITKSIENLLVVCLNAKLVFQFLAFICWLSFLSINLTNHFGIQSYFIDDFQATRSAAQSFRIRMTYTHMGSSGNPVDYPCSGLDGCRKRKAGKFLIEYLYNSIYADDDVDTQSAPVINQDILPTASKSLLQEYTRNVSQTRWIIDDERMGEASVEELIGKVIISKLGAESFKFHAAGREDIDVRMLGSGRPFLVEVTNACTVPSCDDIREIVHLINNEERRLIGVKNVKIVGKEAWDLMREGEAEKQKQYAALVWISRPLTDQDLEYISNVKDLEVSQRTPIRVLHRRSPLERKRIIHWMRGQRVAGSSQYFMLHLCTQGLVFLFTSYPEKNEVLIDSRRDVPRRRELLKGTGHEFGVLEVRRVLAFDKRHGVPFEFRKPEGDGLASLPAGSWLPFRMLLIALFPNVQSPVFQLKR
ncbi:putative tRNA pseudouridine synthase [Nymphaea thermarum]|nr:putative tRNA pseudouridine synthase [Nymphaea thermarum]